MLDLVNLAKRERFTALNTVTHAPGAVPKVILKLFVGGLKLFVFFLTGHSVSPTIRLVANVLRSEIVRVRWR